MAKLETPSILEKILDQLQQLSEQEQRTLAHRVLNDRKLESFVEELDDQLSCEPEELTSEPFSSEELAGP